MYSTKDETDTSWYSTDCQPSLLLIASVVNPPAQVLDLGAGRSELTGALLDLGYHVSALDVSEQALSFIAAAHPQVTTIVADITTWAPPKQYEVIHDRAVFHFMTTPEQVQSYVQVMHAALAPGGHLVMGTFALNGPTSCSGLPVARYSAEQLAALFADFCTLEQSLSQVHVTPWGADQSFTWIVLRRTA